MAKPTFKPKRVQVTPPLPKSDYVPYDRQALMYYDLYFPLQTSPNARGYVVTRRGERVETSLQTLAVLKTLIRLSKEVPASEVPAFKKAVEDILEEIIMYPAMSLDICEAMSLLNVSTSVDLDNVITTLLFSRIVENPRNLIHRGTYTMKKIVEKRTGALELNICTDSPSSPPPTIPLRLCEQAKSLGIKSYKVKHLDKSTPSYYWIGSNVPATGVKYDKEDSTTLIHSIWRKV